MSEPDWLQLLKVVRRYLSAHARDFNLSPAEIDDLCGIAALDALTYLRLHTIDNFEAFLITCAQRAARDYTSSRRRWRIIRPPVDGDLTTSTSAPSTDATLGDPAARVRTVVLMFFKSREQGCFDLARAYFAEQRWSRLAQSLGMAAATARQRWSRCVAKLRAAIMADKALAQLLDLHLDEGTP